MKRKKWTKEELDLLKDKYTTTDSAIIAKELGRTLSQIYNAAYKLNLRKDKIFTREQTRRKQLELVQTGKHKGFLKGHKTFNKGKKQSDYMSKDSIEKTKKTRFKKGSIPKNKRPVGYVRCLLKGGYLEVKVSEPSNWELLHRCNWEKENGKIPKGHSLVFKDGNPSNCNIENLELLSNVELMKRNTIHRFPPEIKKVINLNSKLKKTIKKCLEIQS